MAQPDATQLAHFYAQESHLFAAHIAAAAQKFREGGALPASLFGARAVKALEKAAGGKRKRKDAGVKRKPTAFNLFVKEKLDDLKRTGGGEGGSQTSHFKDAVSAWGKLSEEQKAQYALKYAPIIAAAGGEGAAASKPLPKAAAGPATKVGAAAAEDSDIEDDDEDEDEDEEEPPAKGAAGAVKAAAVAFDEDEDDDDEDEDEEEDEDEGEDDEDDTDDEDDDDDDEEKESSEEAAPPPPPVEKKPKKHSKEKKGQ